MESESREWCVKAPWGNIACVSWGLPQNRPILMVHGYMDSAATFIPIVKHLPDDYFYLAVDLPGHGKSDPFPIGMVISQAHQIVAVRRVVEYFKWDKFVCFTHSVGFAIGALYNFLYPFEIEKTVNLDPVPPLSTYCSNEYNPMLYYQYQYDDYYDNYSRWEFHRNKQYTYDQAIQLLVRSRKLTKEQSAVVLSRTLIPLSNGMFKLSWEPTMKKVVNVAVTEDTLSSIVTTNAPPMLNIVASIDETIKDNEAKKKYTKEDLQNAFTAIRNGCSVYKVSRNYSIPETTLRNKRDKKYCYDVPGRRTVLSKSEETKVVDWIHYLGKHGFPVSKEQLKQGVAKLVENLNRPNTFKDGIPGKRWLANFLSRHPTVARRVAQTLPTHRNKITEQDVRSWFDRVRSFFETNNLLDVLEDESRVFNCDETAFFLCPKEKDVLVKKGTKRVYNRVANDEKECLTVLVNVCASGKIAPPMVLYPYKRLPKNLPLTVPSTWGIGCTESGWMNMEAFYEYVANVFYKWLLENKIKMPVALFMDGHTSHISLPLSLFCKERGIILIALLPNSTHLLQPLDVGVFRPVKGTWKHVVHEFRVRNNYAKLKRTDFANEVQKCFEKSLKADTIKNSFKSAGIFPFNANNIDFTKVIPQESESTIIISQAKSTEKSSEFLEQFEKRLAPEVFILFLESKSEWEGEERYRCLFEFWKKIQNEESQPPSIFNDTTIVNNIPDCDVSDVVMNMEINSNGSIILPLSPNTNKNDAINLQNIDQQLTPRNKYSRRYLSDSNAGVHKETSLGYVNEDPQPSDSRNRNHPVYQVRSRPSSSDRSLETLSSIGYVHQQSTTEVINQASSQTATKVNIDPKPCCSRNLDPPIFQASSRQSSSDLSLDLFDPADNTNQKSADNPIAVKSTPSKLNFPTPFKSAFYFPKSPKNDIKTRKTKKLTPTVAVSNEFIEYQRRIAKEKEDKSTAILKRRAERLQKQEEKKSQSLKIIQKRKKCQNNTKKRALKTCLKKPNILEKIEEDQETERYRNESIILCDDDNKQMKPLPYRRIHLPCMFHSDASSDDESVTLSIRNQKASIVKKNYTKLFGEHTSDSSM